MHKLSSSTATRFLWISICLLIPCRHASQAAENRDRAAVAENVADPLPDVDESLEDIRSHLTKWERGTPQYEAWRIKALIKLDPIRQQEGVEGLSQVVVDQEASDIAVVHGDPGRIAWRALTCWNPACLGKGKAGGPVLFVHPLKHASLGTDGKLRWRTLDEKELSAMSPVVCPVCAMPGHVRPYDTPQVELRRQQLTEEMEAARKVRAQAAEDKKLVPAGGRTPSEIMRDLSQLPKLYLVPDQK